MGIKIFRRENCGHTNILHENVGQQNILQEAFWASKETVGPKEVIQAFHVSLTTVEKVNKHQVLLEVTYFSVVVVATCIYMLDTSGHHITK